MPLNVPISARKLATSLKLGFRLSIERIFEIIEKLSIPRWSVKEFFSNTGERLTDK